MLLFFRLEGRNFLNSGDYLFRGDELSTLKVTVGSLVAGTPEEIKVVKVEPHIVPAAVAGVVVDHPVWSFKLIGRVGET